MTAQPLPIGLADDHHLVRASLRLLLEAEGEFKVVAEVGDGPSALDLVRDHRPAVLVLDLMLPGMGGLGVIRHVAREWPETAIVVLSMHGNSAYVVEALRNGAKGYVLKSAERGELAKGITLAATGRRYLCSNLSERAISAFAEVGADGADPLLDLTEREVEALHLAIAGHSVSEIAERLFISPRTAEKHRARAMKKLGLRSAQDLARFGIVRGLLPMPAAPDDP